MTQELALTISSRWSSTANKCHWKDIFFLSGPPMFWFLHSYLITQTVILYPLWCFILEVHVDGSHRFIESRRELCHDLVWLLYNIWKKFLSSDCFISAINLWQNQSIPFKKTMSLHQETSSGGEFMMSLGKVLQGFIILMVKTLILNFSDLNFKPPTLVTAFVVKEFSIFNSASVIP